MTDDDGFLWYSGGERLPDRIERALERIVDAELRAECEAAIAEVERIAKRKAIIEHAASDVWPEDHPDIWARLGLEKPHD